MFGLLLFPRCVFFIPASDEIHGVYFVVMNSKQHRTHCACASTVRQHLVYSV
jgi:hypothetical protein